MVQLYIEGYLQAMLDVMYKQDYLRVRVIDNQVYFGYSVLVLVHLICKILIIIYNFLAVISCTKGMLCWFQFEGVVS